MTTPIEWRRGRLTAVAAVVRLRHRRGSPRFVGGYYFAMLHLRGPTVIRQRLLHAWTKEEAERAWWRTQLKCIKFTLRLRRWLIPFVLEMELARRQPLRLWPWLLAVAANLKPT
jgi:hypothetical protein